MNTRLSILLAFFSTIVVSTLTTCSLYAENQISKPLRLTGPFDPGTLKPGRHHFYFEVSTSNTGVPRHVPIIVIKGAQSGRRLLLSAGVHGDELNGIRVIHKLLEAVNHTELSGTIIALPGVNQSGLNANSRYFISSSGGGAQSDLNRLFPGTRHGGNAASLYVHKLWSELIKDRVDIALDLHTQTSGAIYPLFVFADFKNAEAKKMADLLMPDAIKNDSGEKGTLETSLIRAGVPSVTFEIGGPKRFDGILIDRAVKGIKNIMHHYMMLAGNTITTYKPPVIGHHYKNVYAETGGVTVLHKRLMDRVKKDDLVAVQYDLFGNKIREYFAPVDGHVLSLATDPMREPGAMIVRILY
jgi:predicted deacylase